MAVEEYDLEWLQKQIYDLQHEITDLQGIVQLLQNEINILKYEGCALSKDILTSFKDDGK